MNHADTMTIPEPATIRLPSKGHAGMVCLIIAETAIFTIFVVAYLYYIGRDISGPTPREVLERPGFNQLGLNSLCLFSSSLTIHFALVALKRNNVRLFGIWWFVTFLLGAYFLWGTWLEWRELIYHRGLTISTNLFGTTFYSLVGLHAFHVLLGAIALFTVTLLTWAGTVKKEHHDRMDVLSWYWHFVDCVWVVVLTVVYFIGR
jgi:cytochrome c oxidase subunit 3/cytochrome o ubiquinol oxidase subunit 3